jgi:hypothetical protein
MEQTRTLHGRFEPSAPDWHYVPVDVPEGVREIEVRYTYDQPAYPTAGNRIDIGIFDPNGHGLGETGFRGWSGGSRESFVISASDATPGYLPGPIHAGVWYVVLGPYAISAPGMNWTVEVTLRFGTAGPAFQPDPAPETPETPVRRAAHRGPRWFRGDPHVHTTHSDGLRTPDELVSAARSAGLDFIVSTEHNTSSASLHWGRHARPDLLIIDGEEVTTRNGLGSLLGCTPGNGSIGATDPTMDSCLVSFRTCAGLAVSRSPLIPIARSPDAIGDSGWTIWMGSRCGTAPGPRTMRPHSRFGIGSCGTGDASPPWAAVTRIANRRWLVCRRP